MSNFAIIKSKNIIQNLKSSVPEFFANADVDHNDPPYYILARFADFLIKGIEEEELPKDVINRAFSFINSAFASTDTSAIDAIYISIFETFSEHPKCIELCNKLLSDRARQSLIETL